jgi:hypothetical protein
MALQFRGLWPALALGCGLLFAQSVAVAAEPETAKIASSATASGAAYALATLRSGKELLVYRINVQTGETHGVIDTSLKRVEEKTPPPRGDYELALVPTKDGRAHWAVRLDRLSGRMWYATQNQWVEYAK